MQAEFALALLREARARYVRTAVETCGCCDQNVLMEAGRYLQYVLFDIKHMDSAIHKEQTGMPNKIIQDNLKMLCKTYPEMPVLVRTPVIPGFNDNKEAIQGIASFVDELARTYNTHVDYEMLAYHRLGTQKYEFLDKPMPMGDVKLSKRLFAELQEEARKILGDRLHTSK